ncbi:C40 family peptidase [Haemophilus influenzae]|uniref:C40 family peptidase n=1 Tax=Haemophilus influenzae TaxID=727 RepID=UPI000C32974B|nr:C40 family peptidase [Haemophilus influenzae]PKF66388.1 phage tail protein [Haemophilus influenzae]
MIDDKLKQEILAHAEQCKPQESCGFVVFDGKQNIYIPCVNVSPDPINYFEVAPEEFIAAEEIGHIVALVHSHPDSAEEKGLPYLSTADRECQVRLDLDFWLVVSGEIKQFRNIPPLLGRQFENNKQDCRNIVLDSYMLAGVELPDKSEYAFDWFESSNLYEDGLQRCGFYKLMQEDDAQLGDVVLIQVGADVANHAGIYLGNQTILHHSQDRLSARVPYGGFWLNNTNSVWRFKDWYKLNFTAVLNDLQMSR